MRIVILIQARMNSARLPGKVLRPARGRPMLGYLVERLRRVSAADGIALAASTEAADDPLAAFAEFQGLPCHRGPLDDVAGRLLAAARAERADALVRISGDSPLLDPALVDRAVALFRAERPDLVSNVQRRTFPKGQSVEVIATAALARAYAAMTTAEEREHATLHLYARPERFRILNITAEPPRGSLQLSVDTPEDLARFEAILGRLGPPYESHSLAAVIAAADALEGSRGA